MATVALDPMHDTEEKHPLRTSVKQAMQTYFSDLAGHDPANLYDLVLEEFEVPVLKSVMEYCKGNQCRASRIMGISRTTLRKKLRKYDL